MKELEELENLINAINENLTPIAEQINTKIDFLNSFIGEENSYKFNKITMEEISKE